MNIRMSTKGKRPMRSLTPSDKIHAIQRIHDGESKASVARDIGVPESTLRGWCKNEDKLRFMSRQSTADKMATDAISEKLDGVSALLGSPPEKRQKMDTTLPLNFSSKIKYDELPYKRSSLNGLDFSTSKALTDLNFNGLPPEYASFNGTSKNKGYGADISRQNDSSMAAISPLSSLSHLSGLTGLSHSPLAISFNELTSNLNLLAQLNPGLAAMSGLNGLGSTANQLRNVKPKAASQIPSPRCEGTDRQHGLSVKNWAKQKPPTSTSNEHNFGLNLTQGDAKSKIKCPSPSLAPSLGNNVPIAAMPDDPLLYWLKSQQAMLGLYPPPPPPIAATSPPIRSSTPQQIPLASTSLTPSTPSGSLDDKNSAWFNWCKAFGASLNSLAPIAVAAMHPLHQPVTSTVMEGSNTSNQASIQKPPFENILYSHLTKDSSSPSVQSSSSAENLHNNEVTSNTNLAGKPEDLSAKSTKTTSPTSSPIPAHSPTVNNRQTPSSERSPTHSPDIRSEAGLETATHDENAEEGVADCKDMLDNLLYKINNNRENISPRSSANAVIADAVSESSCNSDSLHNNNDLSTNNNNNSNKTDEEERSKSVAHNDSVSEDQEAIQHGEKFLKWLENCSNPRVTTMQLMQLKCLISAIKSGTECDQKVCNNDCNSIPETTSKAIEEAPEDCSRAKLRRRK